MDSQHIQRARFIGSNLSYTKGFGMQFSTKSNMLTTNAAHLNPVKCTDVIIIMLDSSVVITLTP